MMKELAMPKERLYSDLAWIWPIMSPPEYYIEEAEFFITLNELHAKISGKTALNLGCGGGHIDKTLKRAFKITGVDQSESMLELARKLNPEAEYFQGDMRNVRLDRKFDIVVVHDAISYMLTEYDLYGVFQTAYHHLKPGGMFMTVVEETAGNFKQNKTFCYSNSRGDTEITTVENYYDPNEDDTTYELAFVYLIRQNKKLSIQVDNHICGIFPSDTWRNLLTGVGFKEIGEAKFQQMTFPWNGYVVLYCFKPE